MLLLSSTGTRTAVANICRVSAKIKLLTDKHTQRNSMASNQRQMLAAADGSSSMPTPAAAIDFLMLLSKLKVSGRPGVIQ